MSKKIDIVKRSLYTFFHETFKPPVPVTHNIFLLIIGGIPSLAEQILRVFQ